MNVQIQTFKRPLECSYLHTQYQTMKWILKLSIPSSIISGSKWEILKHIKELQPNLPYAYKRRLHINHCRNFIHLGWKYLTQRRMKTSIYWAYILLVRSISQIFIIKQRQNLWNFLVPWNGVHIFLSFYLFSFHPHLWKVKN